MPALAAALTGPAPPPDAPDEAVVAAVIEHGIAGGLAASGALAQWPDAIAGPLLRQARAQTIWELRHRVVLRDLLAALDAAGVRTLLLKGTALAYTLYDPPSARARGDSDLLVAAGQVALARSVLRARGFASTLENVLDDQLRQETWSLDAADGTVHDIDLHWRLANDAALSGVLPEAEVLAESVPLPALGPAARTPAPHHALIHAAIHRAGHRVAPYFVDGARLEATDRLIWLRDIDLMVRALTEAEQERLELRALDRGVGPVVAEALATTQALFGTPLPEGWPDRLAAGAEGPAARFLSEDSRFGRVLRNVAASERPISRLRFALLPPAAQVRAQLPDLEDRPLAWLYLVRLGRFLVGRR